MFKICRYIIYLFEFMWIKMNLQKIGVRQSIKKSFHNTIQVVFSDHRQVNEACSSSVHFELQVH